MDPLTGNTHRKMARRIFNSCPVFDRLCALRASLVNFLVIKIKKTRGIKKGENGNEIKEIRENGRII